MASNYLRTQFNEHIFGTDSYSKPSVLAIALCTDVPDPFNTGATIPELPNSGSYARQILNPDDNHWSIVGGVVTNLEAITFPVATTEWPAIECIAILDSATWGEGNLLFFGGLDEARYISQGNQLVFEISGITVKTI